MREPLQLAEAEHRAVALDGVQGAEGPRDRVRRRAGAPPARSAPTPCRRAARGPRPGTCRSGPGGPRPSRRPARAAPSWRLLLLPAAAGRPRPRCPATRTRAGSPAADGARVPDEQRTAGSSRLQPGDDERDRPRRRRAVGGAQRTAGRSGPPPRPRAAPVRRAAPPEKASSSASLRLAAEEAVSRPPTISARPVSDAPGRSSPRSPVAEVMVSGVTDAGRRRRGPTPVPAAARERSARRSASPRPAPRAGRGSPGRGGETLLLLEQLVDREDAHRALLELERDARDGLAGRAPAPAAYQGSPARSASQRSAGSRSVLALQQVALVGDVHELHPPGLRLEEPDAEDLGADQVEQDLPDDGDDRLLVERRVQLVAGDVEVEQVLVLVLDLLVALAEVLVLAVEGLELGLDLLELPAQLLVLADHVVACRSLAALGHARRVPAAGGRPCSAGARSPA